MSTAPTLTRHFTNYVEGDDQPRYLAAPVAPQEWARPSVPAKKCPRPVGEMGLALEFIRLCVPGGQAVRGLDDTYVFENRPVVVRFIEEYRLHGLLVQAKEPLLTQFGKNSLKTLSLLFDDEGFETLFCIVSVTGNWQQQREALRAFDHDWWLQNARKASGRLNFDFQIVNAIQL